MKLLECRLFWATQPELGQEMAAADILDIQTEHMPRDPTRRGQGVFINLFRCAATRRPLRLVCTLGALGCAALAMDRVSRHVRHSCHYRGLKIYDQTKLSAPGHSAVCDMERLFPCRMASSTAASTSAAPEVPISMGSMSFLWSSLPGLGKSQCSFIMFIMISTK